MEKSSGSDWGESRQRRQRGMKLRWLSLLPAKNNLYFLLYGLWFCSSGWVSDLTEWYQTRNRLLKAFRLLSKVCARQLSMSQESEQNFWKLLELKVLVSSCAFPSPSLRCRVEIAKHASMWDVLTCLQHFDALKVWTPNWPREQRRYSERSIVFDSPPTCGIMSNKSRPTGTEDNHFRFSA